MTNFSNLLNIILVHGLWGNAGHWSGVISELGHKGYTVDNLQALDLGLLSLESDAARLKTAIDSKNGSVLLVGHSYGGEVITMAGDDPKVKGLVYIAALALDQGESLATIQAQYPPVGADNIYVDSDNYVWIKHDKFRETFCQDLSEAEAFPLNVGQHAPLANVLTDNVTTVAWKTKPSWYQVSTQDHTINPEAEEFMAKRINARKTLRLDSDHASLASHPCEIAAFIDEAARGCSDHPPLPQHNHPKEDKHGGGPPGAQKEK